LPVISFSFPGNPTHPTDLPDCVRYYLVKPFTNQVLVDTILSLGKDVHRLLVVDDDPAMINLVTRALRSRLKSRWIAVPDCARRNGPRSLRKHHRTPPDAILLDINLPDMSGMEILTEAQQQEIPVIFITAQEWAQSPQITALIPARANAPAFNPQRTYAGAERSARGDPSAVSNRFERANSSSSSAWLIGFFRNPFAPSE
jgi:CheY-like chemotaxis protein